MIDVKELRVGNLVQRPEKLRMDILDGGLIYYGVNILMLQDCERLKDNWAFEGIPLTTEWLKKFGFEKRELAYMWYVMNFEFPFDHFEISLRCSFGKWYVRIGTITVVEIYSLHQLQNLINALTGTELEIKEGV
jgi:hypothetical protein